MVALREVVGCLPLHPHANIINNIQHYGVLRIFVQVLVPSAWNDYKHEAITSHDTQKKSASTCMLFPRPDRRDGRAFSCIAGKIEEKRNRKNGSGEKNSNGR